MLFTNIAIIIFEKKVFKKFVLYTDNTLILYH